MKLGSLLWISVLVSVCSGCLIESSAETGSISGVDQDGDGVRDDVEEYILEEYGEEPAVRDALLQLAEALQNALLEAESEEASNKNAVDADRALNCLFAVSPDDAYDLSMEVQSRVVNTEERMEAYLRYNGYMGGKVFEAGKSKEWLDSCEPRKSQ